VDREVGSLCLIHWCWHIRSGDIHLSIFKSSLARVFNNYSTQRKVHAHTSLPLRARLAENPFVDSPPTHLPSSKKFVQEQALTNTAGNKRGVCNKKKTPDPTIYWTRRDSNSCNSRYANAASVEPKPR
jgi:hypothetical protein